MLAIAPILLLLSAEGSPPPTVHDRAFWRNIVDHGYALPPGQSAAPLIEELSRYLGSPDRELRDEFAYSIPARWIYHDKRLTPEELQLLRRKWAANLEVALGETGTDGVLLRSFSALDLSVLAALDLDRPFLADAEFNELLGQALEYLARERDVRGYEERVGWIHSTAHTADLLKFLARNTKLKTADQARIVVAIAAKLEGAGSVFTHGEDERLAGALLSLVRRADFDPAALQAWCDRLKSAETKLGDAPIFDHNRFIALHNQKNALKNLALLLFGQKSLLPAGKDIEDRLLAVLVG